jgi:hypothetical protein
VNVTVPAGSYPSEVYLYATDDNSESIKNYKHFTTGNASPLNGMIKYEWQINEQKIVVELVQWSLTQFIFLPIRQYLKTFHDTHKTIHGTHHNDNI